MAHIGQLLIVRLLGDRTVVFLVGLVAVDALTSSELVNTIFLPLVRSRVLEGERDTLSLDILVERIKGTRTQDCERGRRDNNSITNKKRT